MSSLWDKHTYTHKLACTNITKLHPLPNGQLLNMIHDVDLLVHWYIQLVDQYPKKYVEAFISSVIPLQIIWFSYCPLISSVFFNLSSPSPSHIIKSKQIFCKLEQTQKKMPWMQHATERNKPTHPRSSESAIWKNSPWYLPKTDTETTRVYECLSPFSCFFFLAKYCWLSHLRKETQVK